MTITYLEQTSPSDHTPKTTNDPLFTVKELGVPLPSFNKYFYTEVGRDWHWTDKLAWTADDWARYAATIKTVVGYYNETPAGYFELRPEADAVELAYFGLLPEFVGKGLGGALLSCALDKAWTLSPKRVWVHTCSLDHPAALSNYRARGFKVYRTETVQKPS